MTTDQSEDWVMRRVVTLRLQIFLMVSFLIGVLIFWVRKGTSDTTTFLLVGFMVYGVAVFIVYSLVKLRRIESLNVNKIENITVSLNKLSDQKKALENDFTRQLWKDLQLKKKELKKIQSLNAKYVARVNELLQKEQLLRETLTFDRDDLNLFFNLSKKDRLRIIMEGDIVRVETETFRSISKADFFFKEVLPLVNMGLIRLEPRQGHLLLTVTEKGKALRNAIAEYRKVQV